jgi:hypothetical protein
MILATSLLFNEFESITPRQFCDISSSAIYCTLIRFIEYFYHSEHLWLYFVVCHLDLVEVAQPQR